MHITLLTYVLSTQYAMEGFKALYSLKHAVIH